MFCSTCGSEVNGKFCIKCGTPAGVQVSEPITQLVEKPTSQPSLDINSPNIQTVNGAQIDLHKIVRICGKNKLGAAARLSQESGLTLRKTKEIMYPLYDQLGTQVNMKFSERLKSEFSLIADKSDEKQALKARYDREGTTYCPKCLSTSLSANKKGFGIGKAVIGAAFTGGIGLVAGNLGAKKVRVTCLKCGNQFMAGQK